MLGGESVSVGAYMGHRPSWDEYPVPPSMTRLVAPAWRTVVSSSCMPATAKLTIGQSPPLAVVLPFFQQVNCWSCVPEDMTGSLKRSKTTAPLSLNAEATCVQNVTVWSR